MNFTKRSLKFAAGDRVRLTDKAPANWGAGPTGTITIESSVSRNAINSHQGYNVRMDNGTLFAGSEVLFYADELEYEDNRDDAIYGEIIAWNLDYVWFNSEDWQPKCKGEPVAMQLFSNLRKGDTALIAQCSVCKEVVGSHSPIPLSEVKNISYLCRYPLTFEDSSRDPFYND